MGINNSCVRRALATVAAATVAGWGAFALPAAADPGNGNGNGNGNSASQGHPSQGSGNDDKGPKDGKGPKDSKDDKGPKDNGNGNGPKDGKGPKDDKGPKDNGNGNGPKDDKGPKDGGNGDPAGNNGTVKITPTMEDDGIPQNTPHVSCTFDIEWYGFDEGKDIISTVEFAMQAPTSDVVLSGTEPSKVFVGGDPASGAGTDSGFDGEATYTLAFNGEPHPKQGYHVKLTVHTPGSQGSDTKQKVFWVQPCAAEAAASEEAPAEETPSEAPSQTPSEDDQGADEESSGDDVDAGTMDDQGAADAGAAAGTQAGAADATAADVPNQVDAGGEGSLVSDVFTSPVGLLVIALGLALAGAALVARRRTA